MNEDFSNVNLFLSEKFKLFLMRFRKGVDGSFLGHSLVSLLGLRFITASYPFCDTLKTEGDNPKALYTLTTRYWRYCVWKRNRLFDKILTSIIIPIFVSVATTLLLLKLQELIELLRQQ